MIYLELSFLKSTLHSHLIWIAEDEFNDVTDAYLQIKKYITEFQFG